MVFLNEIKTSIRFSVPGFAVYYSNNKNPHRGGTALLLKNRWVTEITWMDVDTEGQIWLRLSCLPDVTIGGCYIPPSDSPYYDASLFASIQARIMSNTGCSYIIVGDFNARCGHDIHSLIDRSSHTKPAHRYVDLLDHNQAANLNGHHLVQLCKDGGLLILNNLQYGAQFFRGGLTFRQRDRWISALDLCIVSVDLLSAARKLEINQDLAMPSDHAPIGFRMESRALPVSIDSLLERATSLGDHAGLNPQPRGNSALRNNVSAHNLDRRTLKSNLGGVHPPDLAGNTDTGCAEMATVLLDVAQQSKIRRKTKYDVEKHRWQRIIDKKDDRLLWNAINWKGEVRGTQRESPSDEEFRIHFEELLNPLQQEEVTMPDINTNLRVPVVDDPIDTSEVDFVLTKQLKAASGSGPDGIPPVILSSLPAAWIISLTTLFNMVFTSAFPRIWAYARMITIFKKGRVDSCDNYRGITITNSIAKVYDYVLYNRLSLWFRPSREQAGAQPKRGCLEHIVSLRLLMDYCVGKKQKLYVVFIDFSKAYDRIPRDKLMARLSYLGCGFVMLAALASMYKVSYSVLGVAIVTAVLGIRQGSPTSGLLFTVYVDGLITMLKDRCGVDGFLRWLHVLMMMDDTVILATSRTSCTRKLETLLDFCKTSGMIINQSKTKFMVVNASENDKTPLRIEYGESHFEFHWCDVYIYLGSIFHWSGRISNAVIAHAHEKHKHYLKYVAFLSKNDDFPFHVKRKVLTSALMSAVLYGCESWFVKDVSAVNRLYIASVKALLGVRQTTPNDVCLCEIGYPPLNSWVKQRQRNFWETATEQRHGLDDDPLMFCLKLCTTAKTPAGRYIKDLMEQEEYYHTGLERIRTRIRDSSGSKLLAYRSMNPRLSVHDIYRQSVFVIPEHQRKAFTRLRVVAHNLKIETGRWSRHPRDQRLCDCLSIQTEEHVITDCPLSQAVRNDNTHMVFNFPDFFYVNSNVDICRTVQEILSIYSHKEYYNTIMYCTCWTSLHVMLMYVNKLLLLLLLLYSVLQDTDKHHYRARAC